MARFLLIRDQSFSTYAKLKKKRTCAYQGVKNVSFSDIFAYVLNKWMTPTEDLLVNQYLKTFWGFPATRKLGFNFFLVTFQCHTKMLTHLVPLVSFYTLWKHQGNLWVCDVFRRYRKRSGAWNGWRPSLHFLMQRKQAPKFHTSAITIYLYRILDLAVMIAKIVQKVCETSKIRTWYTLENVTFREKSNASWYINSNIE